MSAWETVPEPDEVAAYTEQEWADYMELVYDELGGEAAEARLHDRDGYLAHRAGEEECLALGHVPPDDPADWETVPGHETGWDGDVLCLATKYDTSCTTCEGECSQIVPPLVWDLPGVIGAARA